MSSFPVLKTGAVAQYPIQFSISWSTHVTRFVDGTEQRYPTAANPVRRWKIRLDLLDESEMRSLQRFFASQSGAYAPFEFQDPLSGLIFPNCCFDSDTNEGIQGGEFQNRTALTIRTVA